MQWEVTGADQTTGKDRTLIIEADNAESAQRRGNRRGLLVEMVIPVSAKKTPSPMPAQVVEYAKITDLRNEAAPTANRSRSPLVYLALGMGIGVVAIAVLLLVLAAIRRSPPIAISVSPPPAVAPPTPQVYQTPIQSPHEPSLIMLPQNLVFVRPDIQNHFRHNSTP